MDFSVDARRAYFMRQPLPGSQGGEAVRLLDTDHLDDGRSLYFAARSLDGGPPLVRAIAGADRVSFEVLGDRWSRDGKRLYHQGQVRPGSPASFQVLGRGYVRSDRAVWHLGEPLRGVELKSFEVLPEGAASGPPGDEADARDATRRYRGGEPLARSR